jgi:hypothetical protein
MASVIYAQRLSFYYVVRNAVVLKHDLCKSKKAEILTNQLTLKLNLSSGMSNKLKKNCCNTGRACMYLVSKLALERRTTGANPTIAIYNASTVKVYNATSKLVRSANKSIFFCI